jgi:hypothetical protein
MSVVDEVRAFARDYVNNPLSRTSDRKAKIREAHKLLTGRTMSASCSTCYIEAVIKIKNLTEMASSKYELRKGVVLQAFGDPSKICTDKTITDALGDFHFLRLSSSPELINRYFLKYPKVAPKPVEPEKKAEPVKVTSEALTGAKELPDEAQGIVEAFTAPPKPKGRAKPVKKDK